MASYVLTTNWETFSDAVRGAIKNAYDAAAAKGASFSDQTTEKTLANLASFINTIVTGAVTHISKTVSPGAPGTQPVTYSPVNDNVDYYDSVTVNPIPSNYVIPTGKPSTITANGTNINVSGYAAVDVAVPVPSDTTATKAQILSGKTAYIGGAKEEGTMINNQSFSSTITTAGGSVIIPEGYHDGNGVIDIDSSLIIPSGTYTAKLTTLPQSFTVTKYKTCKVTANDADFIAGNIKDGISIFGILGSFTGFTQYNNSTYVSTSRKAVSNLSIEVGFTPKVFVMRTTNVTATASNTYDMSFGFAFSDGNYISNGSGFVYKTNKLGSSLGTDGNAQGPIIRENGVSGNGSSVMLSQATYEWYAWG